MKRWVTHHYCQHKIKLFINAVSIYIADGGACIWCCDVLHNFGYMHLGSAHIKWKLNFAWKISKSSIVKTKRGEREKIKEEKLENDEQNKKNNGKKKRSLEICPCGRVVKAPPVTGNLSLCESGAAIIKGLVICDQRYRVTHSFSCRVFVKNGGFLSSFWVWCAIIRLWSYHKISWSIWGSSS